MPCFLLGLFNLRRHQQPSDSLYKPLNDLNHPEKATIDVNSKAAINVAYGEVPDLSKFVKTWRQEGFAVAGCDAPRPVR